MTDQLRLPEFEGRVPVGVLTTITGTSQRIHRPIHHGDKVILLVEAEVGDIRHPLTKDGLKRKQVLRVDDFYELSDGEGHELLVRLRTEYLDAQGKVELPMNGDEGVPVTVDGDTASVNAAELQAVVDLERGRGRCAHVIAADTFELCLRADAHRGRHQSKRPEDEASS